MRNARRAATVFGVGVILNFIWEMAQAPLYRPMGSFWEATWRCFNASLGDGVLVIAVWLAGGGLFGSTTWFLRLSTGRLAFATGAGLCVAVLIELWGLQAGRWSYTQHMPLVPGTLLGVVPLAQMAVLVPLTFRLAAAWRYSCTRSQ